MTTPGEVRIIETNIDDMGGEFFGFLLERLLNEGVLDVWYTPIYMKKSRPGVKISVLCSSEDEDRFSGILLQETTTLGVRSYSANRTILERNWVKVNTPYGPISVKTAVGSGVKKGLPEYEDCKKAANDHSVPLRTVYQSALSAFLKE